ncbi:DUF4129 domain-containing protein [Ktedonospora formicarum]|uniref:Protein-glutamine gamma-glutamyltransferase-like C-terminal domain-containing protein n=1 Tax=Ktedonospora formicarum TaxID=2778364 RepID=A0A8J3MTQ4_9CHLR|nr:DUF4129 domain-containing protein [Ktedonospora formicarum]GHO44630.1 hypothetical protein KSX_27930 [Ktedonospora formicarum]
MGSAPEPSPKLSQRDEIEARRLLTSSRSEEDSTTDDALSQGERLLPFVYAAMESCAIYAAFCVLAVTGLGGGTPILPLWGAFVPFAAAIWFSQATQFGSEESGQPFLSSAPFRMLVLIVLTLLIIWGGVYAATTPLYNPAWLFASVNDILLLHPEGYRTFLVLIISALLFWRGLALTRRRVEPGDVLNALRIGLGIIIFALLVTSASSGATGIPMLFLVIVLFFSFALIAHSLARASFLRLSHLRGLEGSVSGQERSILSVVGIICLVLCVVGLILVAFVSPDFLSQAQGPLSAIYTALVNALATVALVLVTPLFWLLDSLHLQIQLPPARQRPTISQPPPPHHAQPASTPSPLLFTLEILGVLLIIALICLLIWFIWRRLKRSNALVRRKLQSQQDVRESLWSWRLFTTQLLNFLWTLWWRIFPRREEPANVTSQVAETMNAEPAVRTIREIYRALLQWSAYRGLHRKQEETPSEFEKRLSERLVSGEGEQELHVMTNAYLLTRYGGYIPDESMVGHIQQEWQSFQQKSSTSSPQ